jgi:serine/threonine protein kinase
MTLHLFNQFEGRERRPMKRPGYYSHGDGCRWWLTLSINVNLDAEADGNRCVENKIYASPTRRKAFVKLFQHAIDFSQVPYINNTITRIRLQTKVRERMSGLNEAPEALRRPLEPYMTISLDNLECFVDEDVQSVIRYEYAELYRTRYPLLRFVQLDQVVGIEERDHKLRDGVYKVTDDKNNEFVYKTPISPEDLKAQSNEIESLLLLSHSPHIVALQALVISENPYLTSREASARPVVRGLLLKNAPRGDLRALLWESSAIDWCQRISWALQITSGLRDIHNASIPHNDLKSDNVVINENNDALIIDLGQNKRTYGWSAPKYLTAPPIPPLDFMQKADVYSLGAVLWAIATGNDVNIPIGMDHRDYFKMEEASMPKTYEELVTRCLKHTRNDRPSLDEICALLEGFLKELAKSQGIKAVTRQYTIPKNQSRPNIIWTSFYPLSCLSLGTVQWTAPSPRSATFFRHMARTEVISSISLLEGFDIICSFSSI